MGLPRRQNLSSFYRNLARILRENLIKCINRGVNNSQFIGERAYSEAFLPNKYGGNGILVVDNMGRSRS